jgi:hypothetical protein
MTFVGACEQKLSPRYRTGETEVFERGWEADLRSNQPMFGPGQTR